MESPRRSLSENLMGRVRAFSLAALVAAFFWGIAWKTLYTVNPRHSLNASTVAIPENTPLPCSQRNFSHFENMPPDVMHTLVRFLGSEIAILAFVSKRAFRLLGECDLRFKLVPAIKACFASSPIMADLSTVNQLVTDVKTRMDSQGSQFGTSCFQSFLFCCLKAALGPGGCRFTHSSELESIISHSATLSPSHYRLIYSLLKPQFANVSIGAAIPFTSDTYLYQFSSEEIVEMHKIRLISDGPYTRIASFDLDRDMMQFWLHALIDNPTQFVPLLKYLTEMPVRNVSSKRILKRVYWFLNNSLDDQHLFQYLWLLSVLKIATLQDFETLRLDVFTAFRCLKFNAKAWSFSIMILFQRPEISAYFLTLPFHTPPFLRAILLDIEAFMLCDSGEFASDLVHSAMISQLKDEIASCLLQDSQLLDKARSDSILVNYFKYVIMTNQQPLLRGDDRYAILTSVYLRIYQDLSPEWQDAYSKALCKRS